MREERMACCSHPTTVIFVDDSRKFFSTIQSHLDADKFIPKFFDDPRDALTFFTQEYKPDFFIKNCLDRPEDDHADHRVIDVNLPAIHEEIYNPDRFNQVCVLVVDYAMPGMNGGELTRLLKPYGLKIILLTGEVDEAKAVDLFNEGIIHRYIRKNAIHFEKLLNDAICDLQQQHFQQLSEIVINALTKHPERPISCLDDPFFIRFFNTFITQHDVCEYYLLDQSGSFLFANNQGKLSWLIIKNEGDMEATEFESNIEGVDVPSEIRKAIQNKTQLRHCFTDDTFPEQANDWPKFMYAATKCEGRNLYYYSYIKQPYVYHGIDTKRVISFNDSVDARFERR